MEACHGYFRLNNVVFCDKKMSIIVSITLIFICMLSCFLVYYWLESAREPDATPDTPSFLIEYDEKNYEVILNGKIVVTCFRSDSLNRHLFEYLLKHPEQKVMYSDLQPIFLGRDVALSKVPDQMGFKKDIKKSLFTCTKNSIVYHPSRLASVKKIKL